MPPAADEAVPVRSPSRSMESPNRKRISYVKAGVLMVRQVKPAILKGTDVRLDVSKNEGVK